MKYVDEFRDRAVVTALAERIKKTVSRPWTIMEVCGGQTHSIVRFGLDELLPKNLTLVHGPGCPVCVTPVSLIDDAVRLARQPGVILWLAPRCKVCSKPVGSSEDFSEPRRRT